MISFNYINNSHQKLTIVLDPGHDGIYDTGTNVLNYNEGDINLRISQKLKKLLDEDYEVILTRDDEKYLGNSHHFVKKEDLDERIRIANQSKCDLFISIHQNYFPISSYYGAEIHYSMTNSANKGLAFIFQNSIKLSLNNTRRDIKENNDIYILKHISSPSCLIECGFMSNKEELASLLDDNYQTKLVKAIALGIDSYFEVMA